MTTRKAFTLVELVVVMALIILLASIAAAVVPGILRDEKVTQGANLVQGMLLTARMRAVRDNVPCGVRLYQSTDPNGNTVSNELAYITQPTDFSYQYDTLTFFSSNTARAAAADFAGGLATASVTGTTATPEEFPVHFGDFLEINGKKVPTLILSISQSSAVTGTNRYDTLTLLNNLWPPTQTFPATAQSYRIIRGPRRMPSEDSVHLPTDVVVLLKDSASTAYGQIPQRQMTDPGGSSNKYYYDIIFSPTGTLVGNDSGGSSGAPVGSGLVMLYMWDSSRTNVTDGDPALVVVNPRSGIIGVQPVDVTSAGGSLYTYAYDLRMSGM
jgi:prepilin-type N-terminal cleavage/methylation domain-containing protein